MARGSGKFKTKRGGGRNFSRNLQLDENGTAVSVDKRPRRGQDDDSDEDDEEDEEDEEEEEEEEDEDDEDGDAPSSSQHPELTRAERRELKKKQAAEKAKTGDGDEEETDEMLVNPNRAIKKMTISDLNEPRQMSRKEREAKDKKDAQERYWKLHVQGKTDEAKTDLARLAKIRQEREAAQARRKAEAEAKQQELEVKQAGTRTKR